MVIRELDTVREVGRKVTPSFRAITEVAQVVEEGGIAVFPWGKLERRCLAFMCDSADGRATSRINKIKARPPDQVLAVNGYPQLIEEIARIEDSRPLMTAAKRLGVKPVEVLRRTMSRGAVSFVFRARKGVPDTVTEEVDGGRTVMVAGEIEDGSGFDFYTELIRHLHRRNIITAGSSVNRTKSGTYHVFEQKEAHQVLGKDVDIFVYHNPLPRRPPYAFNLESCSTFDMIVDSDTPQVVRFGSVHPSRFREMGDFSISSTAQYLPRHERPYHMVLKAPFRLFGLAT